MKIRSMLLMSCAALLIANAAAQTKTQTAPAKQLTLDDMAATMRVTPLANSGSLQRIPLPAELMMHSQSPDLADLRLFNVSGEPVPFALRGTATESTATTSKKVTLNAFTIRKNGDSLVAGNTSVQIKNGGAEIKVSVEPMSRAAPGDSANVKGIDVGRLIDTRQVEGVLTALEFDMDLPPNQIVSITVEASRDFLNWQTLARAKPVYRFADVGSVVTTPSTAPQATAIELTNGAEIKDRYLRITWPGQSNAVVIRNVTLTMESSKRVPIAQPKRTLAAPTAATSHSQEWQLASPLRLRALALATGKIGTLLPITVLGRDSDQQTWRVIGSTVVFNLEMVDSDGGQSAGKPNLSSNAPLMLNGVSVRQLKIEAPASSAGIAANLIIASIEYEAQEIIAAIKPSEDIIVAVGAIGTNRAASVALPLPTLVPDISAQRLLQIGVVSAVEAVKFYPERVLATDAKPPVNHKTMILWGALLLGVGVLAAMAWVAVRQLKTAKK